MTLSVEVDTQFDTDQWSAIPSSDSFTFILTNGVDEYPLTVSGEEGWVGTGLDIPILDEGEYQVTLSSEYSSEDENPNNWSLSVTKEQEGVYSVSLTYIGEIPLTDTYNVTIDWTTSEGTTDGDPIGFFVLWGVDEPNINSGKGFQVESMDTEMTIELPVYHYFEGQDNQVKPVYDLKLIGDAFEYGLESITWTVTGTEINITVVPFEESEEVEE